MNLARPIVAAALAAALALPLFAGIDRIDLRVEGMT